MKKIVLDIIVALVASVLMPSCHKQTKTTKSDENQKFVTFSVMHDTLYRYPRKMEDTSYTIPPAVRYVCDRAFSCNGNLKEVVIPKTVRKIGIAPLDSCSNLERVYLYAQIDTIPLHFLNGCDKLRELHIANYVPPVVNRFGEAEEFNFHTTFGYADHDSLVLYVPKKSFLKYRNAYGWRLFKHIEVEDIEEDEVEDTSSGFERIKQCIISGDARQFASLVSYPLPRRYPLKPIENKEQMIAYFDIMFDDSIKNILRYSTDDDWDDCGWRGYGFGTGELWVISGSVYAINYMSAKEKALYEKAIKQDIGSLHKSLQDKGWKPYRCFQDLKGKLTLRIDKNGEKYRLLMYHNRNRLSDIPDLCVYGTLDIQGSMANELYTFDVGETTYELDYGLDPTSLRISFSGETIEQHELKVCYWLDLID